MHLIKLCLCQFPQFPMLVESWTAYKKFSCFFECRRKRRDDSQEVLSLVVFQVYTHFKALTVDG